MLARTASAVGNLPPALKSALVLLAVLVVGGVGGWIGRGVLAGPADVPSVSIYQDWRLFCPALKEKDGACEITEDVVDDKSQQRLAHLIIGRDKDKSMVLAVTVPLQVLLEPGIGLKIGDDQVRTFQYKTCTEQGCLSVIPLNDELEAGFAKAQQAGVAVTLPGGKAVELPFSMKGYGDALKAFLSNDERRKSWWRRIWS
jgi:invasion protein IalB